jgi:hypothetical protein
MIFAVCLWAYCEDERKFTSISTMYLERLFHFHVHSCYIALSIKLVNYHLKPNDTYMSHRMLGSFPARWSICVGQLRTFFKSPAVFFGGGEFHYNYNL